MNNAGATAEMLNEEHLDDQRGSDICAQHDGKRRHEAHKAIRRK